jgi:hypothetical protein
VISETSVSTFDLLALIPSCATPLSATPDFAVHDHRRRELRSVTVRPSYETSRP